jgi:hypothetical protein
MKFTAELYRDAAEERATEAEELHCARRYLLAHYVAGLAVECILRGYRFRIDPVFDARHNLYQLFKASRFDELLPGKGKYADRRERIEADFAYVANHWSNTHRYASCEGLRSHLRRIGVHYKGDIAKEHSRRMTSAATRFVAFGIRKWNHCKKE